MGVQRLREAQSDDAQAGPAHDGGKRHLPQLEHDRIAGWDLRSGHEAGTTLTSATRSASTAVVADATPHRRVVEDFVAALAEKRRPACDGREGRRSIALAEALYESARTGALTRIDA